MDASKWSNLGGENIKQNPQEAQRLLSISHKLDPELGTPLFNLGISLHLQGKIEAAIRSYRKAKSLAHSNIQAINKNLCQIWKTIIIIKKNSLKRKNSLRASRRTKPKRLKKTNENNS